MPPTRYRSESAGTQENRHGMGQCAAMIAWSVSQKWLIAASIGISTDAKYGPAVIAMTILTLGALRLS